MKKSIVFIATFLIIAIVIIASSTSKHIDAAQDMRTPQDMTDIYHDIIKLEHQLCSDPKNLKLAAKRHDLAVLYNYSGNLYQHQNIDSNVWFSPNGADRPNLPADMPLYIDPFSFYCDSL